MAAESQFAVDSVRQVGALPVIKAFCDRLGLAELVNELLPMAPQAVVGRGETLVALVMNKLMSPQPLYRLEEWAEQCGAEAILGIRPEYLTDDRVGRLLDQVAENGERIKTAVLLRAVEVFGLDVGRIHFDLTSIEVEGDYDEQNPLWPLITYGYNPLGTGEHKQLRVANITLGDGAVGGLLHNTYDGNTNDINTVLDYTALFCQLRDRFGKIPRLIGDQKLVSQDGMIKLEDAGLHFICPEAHTKALDQVFLALPQDGWKPLDYMSRREAERPPEERTTYRYQEVPLEITVPTGELEAPQPGQRGRPRKVTKTYKFRRFVIHSSEELQAQRKNRGRQRERLESKLADQNRKFLSTYWRRKPREAAQRAVDRLLESTSVGKLYKCVLNQAEKGWQLAWELDQSALEHAQSLDGYYTVAANVPEKAADANQVFRDYKEQSEAERRFADWKGPLKVRPVFLKSNQRIAGLILVLSLALLIFCLIEREVRAQLKDTDGKMQGLLPVSRPVRATGRNILERLKALSIVGVRTDQGHTWHAPRATGVQARLLQLLGVDLNDMLQKLPRALPPAPD
jgi:transposase